MPDCRGAGTVAGTRVQLSDCCPGAESQRSVPGCSWKLHRAGDPRPAGELHPGTESAGYRSRQRHGAALGKVLQCDDRPAVAAAQEIGSVRDGCCACPSNGAEQFQDDITASVLVRNAPRGDYIVQAMVWGDVPDEGCCFNYAQAGLIIYGGDDHFVKLIDSSIRNTRQPNGPRNSHPSRRDEPGTTTASSGSTTDHRGQLQRRVRQCHRHHPPRGPRR